MPVNLLIHILIRKTEDHSKRSLTNLFGEQPRSIWVLVDDVEVEIPFEKLERNAIIVISAGQMIPVDGTIIAGTASIDQHRLTGESQPVEKGIGDAVIASTVLLAEKIHVQTEKTGKQTVAAQIGQILEQTTDFKTTMRSRGEIISDRLTIPTLAISALAYPFLGSSSALAVLSNTIGYKMRVFAPIGMLSFLHIASEKGILIKDGRSLELLNQIDTFVFDKTGTLTMEQPHVSGIHPCAEIGESDLLRYAAAAEYGQTHPIARAILSAARTQELALPAIEDAKYEIGYGIQVQLTERAIRVGSHKFMAMEGISIPESMHALQERCHAQGHSVVMVAFDDQLVGAIELQPTIRPEVKQVIRELHDRNIATYIISGDQEQPTQRLAQTLRIDHYFANR